MSSQTRIPRPCSAILQSIENRDEFIETSEKFIVVDNGYVVRADSELGQHTLRKRKRVLDEEERKSKQTKTDFVCHKFLRGQCPADDGKCKFPHTKQKQLCPKFLHGQCLKRDYSCPYIHAKSSPAEISTVLGSPSSPTHNNTTSIQQTANTTTNTPHELLSDCLPESFCVLDLF
eukprot:c18153_g1_i1.p1 GENE.c18153_g1_i1~~c18153_g1_i1.p1  ORF type:complete len:175 (-),score=37.04 c18153_g1_i1:3-527(-)